MAFKSVKYIFAASILAGSISAHALPLVEINPVSYSFDKATDSGSYNYSDWGGVQITDGHYGTAPWYADLGNGPAYEWVGWVHDARVNIDFDLGSATNINKINIGTVQDHVNDVVIPSAELFSSLDGVTWSSLSSIYSPESPLNNNLHKTLEFDNLSATSQYFRISLMHSLNGPWTFVDEVDFYQDVAAVPEPSVAILIATGFIGLIGFSRSKKA